ncbi:phage filamentation protein Fil family protein [Pectobacterium sp. B1J-3]|uniref:phage filamentation protein Fil family protein n=1 Tax=Pectobacterium sp. B1J-3 TaxID=3385371 RepID=UPI003905B58F
MISIARLLKTQSPSPTLANQGKGWFELPNGKRCQPKPNQVYFAPWSHKPYIPEPKRRSLGRRLMALGGKNASCK